MNNQQNSNIPTFSLNPSRFPMFYPNILQNLTLLNQHNPHPPLHNFDNSINDPSSLEKRKFQSLDSAFSKATEKKLNTGLNEAFLSAMLNDNVPKAPTKISPQNILENTVLQEQVSKVFVNQLQLEMNKFKDYHNFLSGNQALNQNLLLQKMALLNKSQQQQALLPKSTHLFKTPDVPKETSFKSDLTLHSLPQSVCEHHKSQVQPVVNEQSPIVKKEESQDQAPQNPNEEGQTCENPIQIEEPALVAFTRDFPTWDLAKIFSFVNKGKTKDDLVQRPSRLKTQRVSYVKDLEDFPEEKVIKQKPKKKVAPAPKASKTEEKEDDLVVLCKFQQELYRLFGPAELNQAKVLEILKSNQMSLEKAVNSIKKNFAFFQSELLMKKDF